MRPRHAWRVAGFLLLLVPFLPLTSLFGDMDGAQGLVPPSEALLGLFLFGAMAVLFARFVPADGPARCIATLGRDEGAVRWLPAAATLALLGLLLSTSWFAFSRRPLLVDSVVQVFQARIFASGRLTAPAPPGEAFFAVQHMLVDGGKWYSQYPPGHSAILALGAPLSAVWLVPILLSCGTALLLYGFARRAYDLETARLTLLLFPLAPFFWFMGASHMNHVSTLFFVSLFLYCLARWEEGGSPASLFAAGLAIGGALLCRPLTAAAIGLAMAPFVTLAAWRGRDLRSILAGAAGALIGVAVYLAYNAATTGDPLLPGYVKLWGGQHGLGFHSTPWGEVHTPLTGLRNQLTDLSLLSALLFEGPIPALIPAGLLLAAGWATLGWDRRLMTGFLALPFAYLFYWHRDAFLGPRYLYSGLAFLLPLTARGLLELFRRSAGKTLWPRASITRVPVSSVVAALTILCLLYAGFYSAPRRFDVYRSGLASMKVDMMAEARDAEIGEALIFVPVSWGNRLLARMRGLGIPASVSETAYRRGDHCALEMTLRRAEVGDWSRLRSETAVIRLGPGGTSVPVSAGVSNGDPTLRLTPGTAIPAACLEEIAYDRRGYMNYLPFLADQDPALDGPLVIARDLRARNQELMSVYPGRHHLLYRSGGFEAVPAGP